MVRLGWLSADGVQLRASQIRPFLARIVAQFPSGSYTEEGILAQFYQGHWVCWIMLDDDENIVGVAATLVIPDMLFRKVLRINFLVGNNWISWGREALREFEGYAVKNGIHSVEFVGREGFEKILADYKVVGKLYRKVVGPEEIPLAATPNVLQIGTA